MWPFGRSKKVVDTDREDRVEEPQLRGSHQDFFGSESAPEAEIPVVFEVDEEPEAVSAQHTSGVVFDTKVIEVMDVPLAIGLMWTEVSNEQEVRSRVAARNDGYLVRSLSGTPYAAVGTRSSVGAYAGGAVVGLVYPNALVFQHLDDGSHVWLCLIREGLPYPGYDRVIPVERADQEFTRMSAMLQEGSVIGNVSGALRSLDEVISEFSELTPELKKSLVLLKNGTNYKRLVVYGFVLAIAAVLLAFGALYWESILDARKRERLMQDLIRTQQQQEAERARIEAMVASFNKKVAEERQKFDLAGFAVPQWNACEEVRISLPISTWGYIPGKLVCEFKLDSASARVEWEPISERTRVAHRVNLPGVLQPLEIEGNPISTFQITVSNSGVQRIDVDGLKARMTIADWFGIYLRASRFSQPQPVVLSPPVEIQGVEGVSVVRFGDRVPFTLNAVSASDVIELPKTMQLLDRYALRFEKIEWLSPTRGGKNFKGNGTLFMNEE